MAGGRKGARVGTLSCPGPGSFVREPAVPAELAKVPAERLLLR
jgi:hypothetical protein